MTLPLYFPFSLSFQLGRNRRDRTRGLHVSFIWKFHAAELSKRSILGDVRLCACLAKSLKRNKTRGTKRVGDTYDDEEEEHGAVTGNPIQWTSKSVIFVGARNNGHAYPPRRVISRVRARTVLLSAKSKT